MLLTDKLLASTIIKLVPRRVAPNQVTTLRFLLVPVVFYLLFYQQYAWGLIIFALAAFTDALDGAMARTRDQITEWGKLFDPLADKLLVGVAAAILVTRFVSFYLALAIILVELMIILSAYYKKIHGAVGIQANSIGKTKMVLQSLGLLTLLIYVLYPHALLLNGAELLLYLGFVFALFSLFIYRAI